MMITASAVVSSITFKDESITKFKAYINSTEYDCINYNLLTGPVEEGDTVILNTTAVELKLGSGGFHYVISNRSTDAFNNENTGHIMKLRYTPIQISCLAAEAQESEYHDIFNSFDSLNGMPAIAGTLHSMLAPISICLKRVAGKSRIVYIMTDGGALPVWLSDTVKSLLRDNVIYRTITCGNAFGGDLECINIYTALIASKEICHADAAVVCMGPGITGTNTKFGFSGIEQGYIIDAVNKLGGKAVAVPRISFSDKRSRHYGISHHSRLVLGSLCYSKAQIAIPQFNDSRDDILQIQLLESGIGQKHDVMYFDSREIEKVLLKEQPILSTMRRTFEEDKEYFIACGLSALLTRS
ncbi:MAG: DUF3866 family protein [Caulobacteraceae bacterium]